MQQKTLEEILLPILDIIDYQNNKEEFVKKFAKVCLEKTFIDSLTSLPEEKQKQFVQETINKTPEEIQAIAGNYFNAQSYTGKLGEVVGLMIHDYLEAVLPKCSQEQQQKIKEYLTSIGNTKTE